jgi:hypothetical protein
MLSLDARPVFAEQRRSLPIAESAPCIHPRSREPQSPIHRGCQQAKACDQYQVAVALGKPVWNLETRLGDFLKACKCETAYGVKTVRKVRRMPAWQAGPGLGLCWEFGLETALVSCL